MLVNNSIRLAVCAAILGAAVAPGAAMAEQVERGDCVLDGVTFEDRTEWPQSEGQMRMQVAIENTLPTPIGGVVASYLIWVPERPAPVFQANVPRGSTISGGLLPGESIELDFGIFPSERERAFLDAAESVRVVFIVHNVADVVLVGHLPQPLGSGWANDIPSELICE
ncbi:hypothetical protein N0B44_15720 [Roseibacterium beibuensis]|uniref:Uncharacterized protein n=1 Tax=[Roseibacterium] beibuensis TaxID=1193142 RepID=A0ABP9LCR9_9RHOB|nr:hypothetical protein [Roseibacterium beibuensis]MCS6624367.1 hypothetical protein [Roseibacterium beibuensis]